MKRLVARALLAVSLTMPLPVLAQEMKHEHGGAAREEMPLDHSAHTGTLTEDTGDAASPPIPSDHAADAYFDAAAMAAARAELMQEDRVRYSQVLVDRFELQSGRSETRLGWEGEASTGDDGDRFVLSTEGETSRNADDRVELQGKWRHALDPWFNAEVGLRHDFSSGPDRTYLVLGIEGLAPYWIETEAQLFLSNKGDLHARFQASYDQRLTQRLVLRGETEIDLALQKVPELGITSRIPEFSAGARLRYEFSPMFAPYVGVEARREPQSNPVADTGTATNFLFGVQAWF